MSQAELIPFRKLALAVISLAIRDAQASGFSTGSSGTSAQQKRAATSWITDCNRDFKVWCDVAGLDPEYISEAFIAGRLRNVSYTLRGWDRRLAGAP